MDLANYINETMLENAYPLKNGIAYYLRNFANQREQDFLIRKYLERYYLKYYEGDKSLVTEEQYIEKELPQLRVQVHKCLLYNNAMWAIWALRILKEENIGNDKCFNFDFADARTHMFKHVKSLYGF